MVILGTRPEAIKLAPVILELKERTETTPVVVATAQHREMLDQVLDIFHIRPDIDLDLMIPDQTLFDVTGNAIKSFEKVMQKTTPDVILVQGDTTTSFIGALAGFYNKIPIGHVEAGLRTGNKYFPFPEEINRKMVSVLTDYHFAPTAGNRQNLLNEGVSPDNIFITGNTVIDALLMTVKKPPKQEVVIRSDYQRLILITAHRRENFGQPMKNICQSIRQMAEDNPHFHFVYPVHLNQHVQKPVQRYLTNLPNVQLLSPLDYHTFVNLMSKADIILTDSGGIQEEGPSLGKPVLVLRNETERPEAVEAGTVKIVGTDRETIISETLRLLNYPDAYQKMAQAQNPYGDGKASKRIVDLLIEKL
ncbi:UDP-N-acetylglucosamine 2-epimerase (non-hydrolyzing) [bacterium]|nr:UDP-N-acetylglucosamine 2-epimerase (non-hydrolyzing) [bacterium]RQV97824.1 MAG: UDP-N-acetylglucosamine 2-epimerase (non-hydrolyzing) [bacterium]